jgi:hypothetical protein
MGVPQGKRKANRPMEQSARRDTSAPQLPEAAPSAHEYRALLGSPCANPASGAAQHHGSQETNPIREGLETNLNQELRYCDYYSFVSLADFLAWVDRNDGSEPDISHISGR